VADRHQVDPSLLGRAGEAGNRLRRLSQPGRKPDFEAAGRPAPLIEHWEELPAGGRGGEVGEERPKPWGTQQGGDPANPSLPRRSLRAGPQRSGPPEWEEHTLKPWLQAADVRPLQGPPLPLPDCFTIGRVIFIGQAGSEAAYATLTIALGRAPAARGWFERPRWTGFKRDRFFVFCGLVRPAAVPQRPTWPGRWLTHQPSRARGTPRDRQQLPGRLQFFSPQA